MQRRLAVIGASGYTGVELTRLLVAHPNVELAVASSDRWVGEAIETKVGAPSALRYVTNEHAVEQAASCDVALLATPAEVSHVLVPKLLAAGPRVIDLSGAYRLRDAALYPKYYGFEHAHAELLARAFYGLPELLGRPGSGSNRASLLREVRLVANPGCYATAIQLALAPLYAAWQLDRDDESRRIPGPGRVIVDAMSGVTGAGRKAVEEFSFAEIAGDLRAYRLLRHQHQPEIEQGINDAVARAAAGIDVARNVEVTFVPHLLPVQRGILATCHVPLDKPLTADGARFAFETYYKAEHFISIAPSAEQVSLHDVVGTNKCRIGTAVSERNELVVTSAIDNLVKGAAGQAVQNLNLMLGLDERAGLAGLRSFHP
jgi:N-acetyl-gamma-glutamyl-phosphate reductase